MRLFRGCADDAAASPSPGVSGPIRFVYCDEKGKLRIDPEALATLQLLQGPIGVVSLCGDGLQGKTLILNQLLGRNSGFQVGATHSQCTKGLWLWSVAQKRTAPDGTEYNLLLLDSEGIDAYNQTGTFSTQIFSLAVLLSSMFIYNQMGVIDEVALNRLSVVTEVAKHIQVRASGGKATASEFGQFSPIFVWLLRDFYLDMTEDDRKITPHDYLELALRPIQGVGKDVLAENQIRESIRAFFPDRECFALVRPLNNENQLQLLEQFPFDKLSPEFRSGLEALTRFVLERTRLKQMGGTVMNGPMLTGITQSFLDALNHGAVPMISSSWQSKEFQMSKDAECINEEIAYDNNNTSRMEPKRSHQWFMNDGEAELFPNKKPTLQVSSSNSFSEVPAPNLSPWGNLSGIHTSQVTERFLDTERFFDTEVSRSINFMDKNFPYVGDGNLNMGRKVVDDLFLNTSPFGLSVSQSLEDPKSNINYNGIRKVKVSEVRDLENMPMSMGPPYATTEDNNPISKPHDFNKDDNDGSMALRYGQNDIFMAMGQNYKADNALHIANSLGKGDGSILSMAESFPEGANNVIPMGNFSKGDDNIITMNQAYSQGVDNTTSTSQLSDHSLSMGHSFDKGGSNMISFGGYNNEEEVGVSGSLLCSYDLLMSQPSVPKHPDSLTQNGLIGSNANTLLNSVEVNTSGAGRSSKKKDDQKSANKLPPNNFPSNVRSLLSTGILDEVPVKYIAWSREKELRGVIKGTGYLCGCQSCNFSKVINAYEFERHAGCKTKHPNNHIYFENGKTIYGIVQELRSTPQNMLFDVIQTITGSPINQKSFRLWKESFLAATRELQRIYGKDERNQLF